MYFYIDSNKNVTNKTNRTRCFDYNMIYWVVKYLIKNNSASITPQNYLSYEESLRVCTNYLNVYYTLELTIQTTL